MSGKKSGIYSQVKQIGTLTAVPVILVAGPLLGYFGGNWLDSRFRLFPWFTMFGLLVGFVASGREIFILLRQFLEEDKRHHSS